MVRKRFATERGLTNLSWLKSFHTFSFGEYYDAAQMGFRSLRVINDDLVAPGMGFGTHGHKNAEIISYVISGSLEHKDSMGNGAVIEAGNLQYMSAGSGVQHSEFNPSPSSSAHFIQIWLLPQQAGREPRYAERRVHELKQEDALTLFCSPDGREQSIAIRQDASLFFGSLKSGKELSHQTNTSRGRWIHLISGSISISTEEGSEILTAGDGLAIENVESIAIRAQEDSEFLLFDLA